MKRVQIAAVAVVVAVFISAGCGGKPPLPPIQDPMQQVILGAGDVLNITFTYTPEHDMVQTVRPDGMIVLELVGEVMAAGKTPLALHEHLMELYQAHLRDYEIVVTVESLYSRRVYVGGEVGAAGVVDFPGQLTVLSAIMQAGGLNMETASVKNVTVVRQNGNSRMRYVVDLNDALKNPQSDVFYLEPYDVVYVPRTRIAKFNQFINQYFNQIFPEIVLATIPFIVYHELNAD